MRAASVILFAAALLAGLNAGFFFAWSFSVMNGLDTASPAAAIEAMKAMNANVRNAPFAVVFFGAPAVAAAAAIVSMLAGQRRRALLSLLGLMGLAATFVITANLHVPWNEALAVAPIPQDPAQASGVWYEYSAPWTMWNHIRLLTSLTGTAFLTAAFRLKR
ncbi:MAG: anthrone oxygenase family protein [Minwuia sp.]|uniref:anthrone oxygenase family protein n=1 Tax=Minwuia sp. TaxID=2493630 RepID=UPI003A87E26E